MSNRIKTFRVLQKMSQNELAERLGISQKKVSQLENCLVEPSLSEVHGLISLFNCSFNDLFSDEEEDCVSKSVLIRYVPLDKHVDPNFTYLNYGDSNKEAARLRNIGVSNGSHAFFHTSIGGNEYITGYYFVDRILEKGVDDAEISKLTCSAKDDSLIIIGNREKSKILTLPLLFDRKLALELKSLIITADRFDKSSSDLKVISDATREHRELSQIDVDILLRYCMYRG
ncbi:MAG: helix-turn-helix domain-containing protein [Syntrophomonadaceae bacterium]|nr:helix-turn-helix domain-containing protein [Syntrophomonadaceae bacterium]